jgi:ribosome-binding ATPase YchF (GTP1/OBG family)
VDFIVQKIAQIKWVMTDIKGENNMNLEKKEKFYGEIINNLKEELNCLTTKIKTVRENHDFGTYKNLILAYKEVLGLYKEMIEEKKDGMIICNFDNTFKIDKEGNVEMIAEQIMKSIKEQLNKCEIRR